ncbi:MAG: metallopeptidase family protein [Actinomycetota bacterium]|nr:metallopeptidase family protein [Actinomycetota bacterium]
MEKTDFEELILKIIKDIPKKFKEQMKNIDILVDYDSTTTAYSKVKNNITLGLFQGTPNTVKPGHNIIFPDKITIYKKSLDAISKNDIELEHNLKIVILHEIGHYFGLSEEKLKELGCHL